MVNNITYQGVSTNPSDYESPDGDLALSINLIHEDGHLKPIFQPKDTGLTLSSGDKIICIHKTASFKHYIIHNSVAQKIYFVDYDTNTRTEIQSITGDIMSASCLGNTVTIATSEGIRRLLWTSSIVMSESGQSVSQSYVYIDKLPEVNLSFGLNGCIVYNDTGDIVIPGKADTNNNTIEPNSVGIASMTEGIIPKVNQLLADIRKKGRFAMPFFVRYAYRLFDGSVTHQSAPILMTPSSVGCPIVGVDSVSLAGQVEVGHKANFNAVSPSCNLDVAAVMSDEEIASISAMSDVIKSIDIYISEPIYSYDQNGKCTTFAKMKDINYFSVMKINQSEITQIYSDEDIKNNAIEVYTKRSMVELIKSCKGWEYRTIVPLPTKDEKDVSESLSTCSSFYLIKSIPLSDLTRERKNIEIDTGVLESLATKETLPDDWDSHDTYIAEGTTTYNGRTNLYGISKNIFEGYYNQQYVEKHISLSFASGTLDTGSHRFSGRVVNGYTDLMTNTFKITKIYSYIKRDGNILLLKQNAKSLSGVNIVDYMITCANNDIDPGILPRENVIPYYYHPNGDVFEVKFVYEINRQIQSAVTIKTSRHEMLNGSFYFDFYSKQKTLSIDNLPTESVTSIKINNRLYVSDVNNPFVFPVTNIASVGSGSILGISTAAQALSQGQFGSFPIYAFTTDGVWALSVSSTGTYNAVQPISRDVCINPKSITQLDGSVLFATSRGLMLIAGSEVRCISESLNSDTMFSMDSLPFSSQILNIVGTPGNSICGKTFNNYLQGCRIAYDYAGQRIYVFNPNLSGTNDHGAYAYVFSLKSASWGMSSVDLSYPIEAYTDSICVTRDNHVVTFAEDNGAPSCGLFVSRPVKLDLADEYKSIHSILHHGVFMGHRSGTSSPASNVKIAIYGSNDCQMWRLVATSNDHGVRNVRGSAYRYFRIVGVTNLTKGQSITGCSVLFDPRHTHTLH